MALATEDWHWEGNIVSRLVDHFMAEGWSILSVADTRSRQRGVDIACEKDSVQLLVEVKGYPSLGYRDPKRANETKPTSQSKQALNWYARGMLSAMRLQTKNPKAIVALGLPEFPRYMELIEETKAALVRLNIRVYLVSESGDINLARLT